MFRRSTGTWYVANGGGGTVSATWGTTGDVPVNLVPAVQLRYYP